VKVMARSGQASSQRPQKVQAPVSSVSAGLPAPLMASVGQTS
jgi:hypothetical protein